MEENLSIYIHIPFCLSKCYYCDFVSYQNISEEKIKMYVDALCNEILSSADLISSKNVKTIYIGGGTPSFINEDYIKQILDTIYMLTCKDKIEEITLEVNPCTLSYKKAKEYKEIGINRISIGLQSVYDDVLKTIGRKHTYSDFINALNILNDVGFKNISCDLIYPLPNMSYDMLKKEIDITISLKDKYNIKHISVYNLEIHEGTKLDFLIKEGYVSLCDEDTEYKMREYINSKLEESGFHKYEISNYSLLGYESKHNLVYWKQDIYLGFGANASSFINGTRYSNVSGIDEYIKSIQNNKEHIKEKVQMDMLDLMKEYIMLNLRLSSGVDINKFYKRYGKKIDFLFKTEIDELIALGLLEYKNNNQNIVLTNRGAEVANVVFEKFI